MSYLPPRITYEDSTGPVRELLIKHPEILAEGAAILFLAMGCSGIANSLGVPVDSEFRAILEN